MFSKPIKVVDRWVGQQAVNLHNGRFDILYYTFSVSSEKLEEEKIDKAKQVLKNYDCHWERISQILTWNELSKRLLLYIPAHVGENEFEFMLGYESLQNGELKSAFFAFNDDEIVYSHIDP